MNAQAQIEADMREDTVAGQIFGALDFDKKGIITADNFQWYILPFIFFLFCFMAFSFVI